MSTRYRRRNALGASPGESGLGVKPSTVPKPATSGLTRDQPRFSRWLICFPLFATLFLAKWAVPFGPRDLAMAWPLIFLAILIGVISGRVEFDPRRLMLWLAVVGYLGIVQAVRGDSFSLASMLLMMAIYFAYAVRVKGMAKYDVFAVFSRFAMIVAICGIAQFALQFVLPRAVVFPIESWLPRSMLIQNYNYLNPLSYGSAILKSNGVFALEPSFFSQFLAIAMIAELSLANRWPRIALYAAGIVVSYSGTGIIILLVTLPMLIIAQRRWDLLGAGVAGLALLGLFAEQLNLGLFIERAGEFTSVGSSGFERFTGALFLFEQFLWDNPVRAMFGFGAGSFQDFSLRANLPVAEMALTKIVLEFGLIGSALTFGFLGYCLRSVNAPNPVKLAVVVMFFMSGIYTSASHGIALTVLVWIGAVPDSPRERWLASRRRSLASVEQKRRGGEPDRGASGRGTAGVGTGGRRERGLSEVS